MAGRIFTLIALLIAFTTADARIAPRIIGGSDASDIYPYQASIRVGGYHKCGGSLINPQWILTAAHCLVKYNISEYAVVLGSNNVYSGGDAYRPERIIIHPNYKRKGDLGGHDIGLMKIRGFVHYTTVIAPAKLPANNVNESNCTAMFTGWGRTKKAGYTNPLLQEIKLKVIPLPKCRSTYPGVQSTNLCTYTSPGEGLCFGDSGSPLVENGVQIGIASWGSPCANGLPDVYTRVYSYVSWIKSHID